MMLVSIHKLILLLFLLGIAIDPAHAQQWTLEKCLDTAEVHNKSLQIKRNEIAWSSEKAKEAKANLIPKLTVNGEYKYYTDLPYQLMPLSTFNPAASEGQFKEAQFGVPHNINANVTATMPLYNPELYGAIQNSKIASELAKLQYQKSEEEIYMEISNLFYNAQILYYQREFIDSNLRNVERLLDNMELLHEQLLATGTDVNKVRLQLSQLQTQQKSVHNKYVQVLNALKFTMGIPFERHIQIDPEIKYTATADVPISPIVEIRLMQEQKRLLHTELNSLQQSTYLPRVNAFATYGTTGFGYTEQPDDFLNFYPIGFAGLQLSFPIFNGTVTRRKINQKNLELQNNELQLELLKGKNSMEIENANMQRDIAELLIQSSKDQLEQAQKIYQQMELEQRHGTANLTEVLLADNSLREAQQSFLAAVVDYLKSDLELKKLSGKLTQKNH